VIKISNCTVQTQNLTVYNTFSHSFYPGNNFDKKMHLHIHGHINNLFHSDEPEMIKQNIGNCLRIKGFALKMCEGI